jgi:heme exporter protein C
MAWFAIGLYASMMMSSFSYLIWRHVIAHHVAWASGIVGMVVTVSCLVTGMIWGKPTWGTWWVWDARLTSVFFLFMTYLIYIILSNLSLFNARQATIASIFAIVGGINLPIIKWSVDWWHTLHQPASIAKLAAPSIHCSMLYPLFICIFGWALFCLNCVLLISRARIKQHEQWIKSITGNKRA